MSITSRIDAVTGIPSEYRSITPPCPRSVKIELTARCNYACAFCARSLKLRDQKDMERSLFEWLLLEMRQAGVEEIGLFYLGESFLCRWLPEAVEYAKKTCGFPYVFLTTNGSLATPQQVKACIEAGLDSLKFSYNYANEEQFVDVTKTKAALFKKVRENILGARKVRDQIENATGHRCGLYASYIEYDGEQGKLMQDAISEIAEYVDEVYALPLYNQADLMGEAEEKREWVVTGGNRGRLGALREPVPCWALFTEGHITYDGKLSACCFDHDGRFHMGDLTTAGFMEAWHSQKFQGLRQSHLDGKIIGTVCEGCLTHVSG